MVNGIGSSVPPYNSNSGDSPYANAGNSKFVALVEASWEAIKAINNDPSNMNVQVLMQTVNNLASYFKKNGLPETGDPALQIYNDLFNDVVVESGSNSYTLGDLCSNPNGASIIEDYYKGTNNSGMNPNPSEIPNRLFHPVYEIINNDYNYSEFDQQNTPVQYDLQDLEQDLTQYSSDPSYYGPRIASDITKFLSDAKGDPNANPPIPAITDGYLTNLVAILNIGGSNSLATLAANYTTSPTSANLTAFNTALGGITSGSEGSDLLWMAKTSLYWENYPTDSQVSTDNYKSGDSPYANAGNSKFLALVEASWEAIKAINNDPSNMNVEVLMQTVNNLASYFKKNGLPETGDPALQIYNDLFNDVVVESGSNSYTLGDLCSNPNGASIIEDYYKGTNNSGMNPNPSTIPNQLFHSVYEIMDNDYNYSEFDQQNTPVQYDLQDLEQDLTQYSSDPSYYGPRIASDITKFLSDAKGDPTANPPVPAVTDGYLTNLVAMLNMGGSNSLATLAANYTTSPTSANLAAFNTALGGVTSGSEGADLLWMVQNSLSDEHYS